MKKQDVFAKHNAPDNDGPIPTKAKYFDTSRKLLSQEMTMYNKETLIEVMTNVFFF